MLPIFPIHSFDQIADGGTTRPFHATVSENGILTPYVLKIFSKKDIQQKNYILRELFGWFLAKKLDLLVPDMAFIDAKAYKIPEEYKTDLKARHTNVIIGSKNLGSGTLTYSPSLHLKYLDFDEIETIYALDQLIFNIDRNINKPNMLYRDNKIYLIDHERSWGFDNPQMNTIPPYCRNHIFYDILKKSRNDNNLFDTFVYYMQNISYLDFAPLANYLQENGMDISDLSIWFDYLSQVKANIVGFRILLRGTLA